MRKSVSCSALCDFSRRRRQNSLLIYSGHLFQQSFNYNIARIISLKRSLESSVKLGEQKKIQRIACAAVSMSAKFRTRVGRVVLTSGARITLSQTIFYAQAFC